MKSKDEILIETIKRYGMNLDGDFHFIGASIIQRSTFSSYSRILFCEDDFFDENNNPYVMESIVPSDVFERDRLIVFYNDKGDRFLIPLDGDNWSLVGNEVPDLVKNIDLAKAKLIIHRKSLSVDKTIKKISNEDRIKLSNKYDKNLKRGRFVVAGILSSFLWLLLIGLLVIFIVAELGDYPVLGISILVFSFLLFLVLSFFTIRFFCRLTGFKNANYRSVMLFTGLYKVGLYYQINGYYYDGNNWSLCCYSMLSGNEKFLENVRYGEPIYRYSKSDNPKKDRLCYFEEICNR